jgi:hypothetical protein
MYQYRTARVLIDMERDAARVITHPICCSCGTPDALGSATVRKYESMWNPCGPEALIA